MTEPELKQRIMKLQVQLSNIEQETVPCAYHHLQKEISQLLLTLRKQKTKDSQIGEGDTVVVRNMNEGWHHVIQIVNPMQQVSEDTVSSDSLLGRRLLGKSCGSWVTVQKQQQSETYKIMEVNKNY